MITFPILLAYWFGAISRLWRERRVTLDPSQTQPLSMADNDLKATAPAAPTTEAIIINSEHRKVTGRSRRRASRRAPHDVNNMEPVARRILSTLRMDPKNPENLRQVEGVPRGAWRIHDEIDPDAKHAINALRRGEYRLAERILRWDYALDVSPQYLARDCERLRQLYWESFR